ncbi:MAG: hypothetical protein HQL73_01820 [Magnetococcales bacterium]|nr:hypothetical protein [Magnetococcales bacterium]
MSEHDTVANLEWQIDLLAKTATHLPTRLTIRFAAAMDGSGAMTADLINPEELVGVDDKILIDLPLRAWRAFAECTEEALAHEQGQGT